MTRAPLGQQLRTYSLGWMLLVCHLLPLAVHVNAILIDFESLPNHSSQGCYTQHETCIAMLFLEVLVIANETVSVLERSLVETFGQLAFGEVTGRMIVSMLRQILLQRSVQKKLREMLVRQTASLPHEDKDLLSSTMN